MPLTAAEIEIAYRLILERPPSANETANVAGQHDTLSSLSQSFLNSEEFYRKFLSRRAAFEDRLKPVLVHLRIPEADPEGLLEALRAAPGLTPGEEVDADGLAALCARPRPERLKLRYVGGDLDIDAGAALGLPCRRLCSLRRPGERLYRLYRAACAREAGAEMSFGTFLDYSLGSLPHRLELDNGQVRRLSGQAGRDGLGRETLLLRQALHAAMAPDMILGLADRPAALLHKLAEEGFVPPPEAGTGRDGDAGEDPDRALAALNAEQRVIFDGYTAWDNYLYEVCEGLLFPPTD